MTGVSLQDNSSINRTVETSYPSDAGKETMSPLSKQSIASMTSEIIGCPSNKNRLKKELEKNNERFAKLIMTLKERSASLDNDSLPKVMDSRF